MPDAQCVSREAVCLAVFSVRFACSPPYRVRVAWARVGIRVGIRNIWLLASTECRPAELTGLYFCVVKEKSDMGMKIFLR